MAALALLVGVRAACRATGRSQAGHSDAAVCARPPHCGSRTSRGGPSRGGPSRGLCLSRSDGGSVWREHDQVRERRSHAVHLKMGSAKRRVRRDGPMWRGMAGRVGNPPARFR
ncbi:hypothetical protein GCM10023322_32060 [Rugosimonospora acidiphila]|uniref:Secreted protein n=1 Tax=Rugosimonospora acidiphila TaxID=556531 RepID=A0ABP9RSD4_9ACTN